MRRGVPRRFWFSRTRATRRTDRAFRPGGLEVNLEERALLSGSTLTSQATAAITVSPTTLPSASVGVAYDTTVSASGGTGSFTFSVSSGALPAGLTLNSTSGVISGTPTTAAVSDFTVSAKDSAGATGSQAYTLTVANGPVVTNLQRFGYHMQPTIFVLTFNEPLNATTAQNLSNYTLVPIQNGQPGAAISLSSAVYNATKDTVTLSPTNRVYVYAEYRLTVNGTAPNGVADTTGNLLAGQNGKAGTNYVNTFGREILAGPNIPSNVSAAIANRINADWAKSAPARAQLSNFVIALEQKLTAAKNASTVSPAAVVAGDSGAGASQTSLTALVDSLERMHLAVVDAVLATVVPDETKKD